MFKSCMISWCFLCADENNVVVEIKSLNETMKENIGLFSIINHTLNGVPSKICKTCYKFLDEFESRKSRYAKVELMFMELLKTKNKSVDLCSIRSSYGLPSIPVETLDVVEKVGAGSNTHLVSEEINIPDEIIPPQKRTQMKGSDPKAKANFRPIKSVPVTKIFPKVSNPTIHPRILTILRLDLFNCDLCEHNCSTKTAMERHMKQIHLKALSISYKCKICSKSFAKKIILQNHEKIHMVHRPTFDCKLCGKVLSSQTAVANHMQWLHMERKEFKCSNCSKLFATKGSLNEHEKTHSEIKSHVCPICNKTYKTASTLSQHLDTHGKTSYNCSDCGARLNSKRTLRQHMLKHSDVVRHTCDFCSAQFKRSKAYKEHLISVHTEIRAYSCEFCLKTFSNGTNCRKHKKNTHPTELALADKSNKKSLVKLPKIEEILSIGQEKLAVT